MARGVCVLAALFSAAAASSMLPSLSKTGQIKGDARMATVACCGADRSAISAALGATKPSAVSLVDGPTTLALLDGHTSPVEGSLAVAASQVVLLEVRLADIMEGGPNGIAQLLPLLQRSVRLAPDAPKKLLLVAVVDHDPSDASEAEVSALASAQLEQLWRRVKLPEGSTDALAAADVFELQCCFLPHPTAALFSTSVEENLKARFVASESGAYLFADGRYSAAGSAIAAAADSLAAQPTPSETIVTRTADVTAGYACGMASDTATKEFQKGLGALRKAAEASLVPDFGDQAAQLLSDALERYDTEAAALNAAPAFASTRAALRAQLRRALLLPYRKQLSALQKQTLAKFRQKLGAMRPSAEIEDELAAMVKDIKSGYEDKVALLSDDSLGFEDGFERREMYETFKTACEGHVENLRVQGLYLPVKSVKLPVDFSAHWLMLDPFGKDARYDTIDGRDQPRYKVLARPMKHPLDSGFTAKLSDPKRMVFTDKMMS